MLRLLIYINFNSLNGCPPTKVRDACIPPSSYLSFSKQGLFTSYHGVLFSLCFGLRFFFKLSCSFGLSELLSYDFLFRFGLSFGILCLCGYGLLVLHQAVGNNFYLLLSCHELRLRLLLKQIGRGSLAAQVHNGLLRFLFSSMHLCFFFPFSFLVGWSLQSPNCWEWLTNGLDSAHLSAKLKQLSLVKGILYRVNKRDAFNGNSVTPVTLPTDSLEALITISNIPKGLADNKSNVPTIVYTSH